MTKVRNKINTKKNDVKNSKEKIEIKYKKNRKSCHCLGY